jgi:hypothetical protein
MKLTIIPSDQAVYKDGLCFSGLTLANVPLDIHALQWTADTGWIEFTGHSKPNEEITTLPIWVNGCLEEWQNAYDAEQVAIAQADIPVAKPPEEQPVTVGMQTL